MRPASILRREAEAAVATLASPAAGLPLPRVRRPALPGWARTTGAWATRAAVGICAALVAVAVLLSAAPHLLPVQTFTVLSGSMQPTIPVGAIVLATPVRASDLRLGDIVTFETPGRPDRLITHRIYRVGHSASGLLFETKGDANAAADPWELQPTAPVYRYLFQVPLLGYLVVGSQAAAARIAMAILAVAGFAFLWRRTGDDRAEASRA